MKGIILGLIATGTIAVASPSSASVNYDFTGTTGEGTNSFTLTTDNFILSDETFPAADLGSCSIPLGLTCTSVEFNPSVDPNKLYIRDNSGGIVLFTFPAGSFASDGTFLADAHASAGSGTLVVSEVSSGVPEPSTWATMLFGFGLTGLALRRRRRPQLACAKSLI